MGVGAIIGICSVVVMALSGFATLHGFLLRTIIRAENANLLLQVGDKYMTKEACKAIRAECSEHRKLEAPKK